LPDDYRIWSDDVPLPSRRDGFTARMGGRWVYTLSRSLLVCEPNITDSYRAQLTRYIMTSGDEVIITTADFENIKALRLPTIREKLNLLLIELAKLTGGRPGTLKFEDTSPASVLGLCRAANLHDTKELVDLLNHLSGSGLIEFTRHSSGSRIRTLVDGIAHAEDSALPNVQSRTAFVAMWFDPSVRTAYVDGIAPAIEENGFLPTRIDGAQFNHKIDDEIIAAIRRSRFLVSDFSCGDDGARGGVYYEAGFAHALGIPVIFTVRAHDVPRLHFDTRQFNHIVWNDPSDLKKALSARIGATIGEYRTN